MSDKLGLSSRVERRAKEAAYDKENVDVLWFLMRVAYPIGVVSVLWMAFGDPTWNRAVNLAVATVWVTVLVRIFRIWMDGLLEEVGFPKSERDEKRFLSPDALALWAGKRLGRDVIEVSLTLALATFLIVSGSIAAAIAYTASYWYFRQWFRRRVGRFIDEIDGAGLRFDHESKNCPSVIEV